MFYVFMVSEVDKRRQTDKVMRDSIIEYATVGHTDRHKRGQDSKSKDKYREETMKSSLSAFMLSAQASNQQNA